MIIKQKDQYGRKFYVSAFTGKVVKLARVTGRSKIKMPNYVFNNFRKPQQRGNTKAEDIIK